ncbi:hypothetical protein ACN9MB_09020 [Dyella kyungheensis]|uniref:hypothetical protein n=1 Tax=Dyella kyungheensis TaxID=1242174 RepID=UPI003CEA6EEB
MKPILAIDPGLYGAVAAYDGNKLAVYDMPIIETNKKTVLDLEKLWGLMLVLTHISRDVVIESVHNMPNQGRTSIFSFGRTCGATDMAVIAAGATLHLVTPQQWKFGVGLNAVPGQDRKERKNASRAKAIELFPEYADLFARVKDDGRAEAALMAWWFVHKKPNSISIRSTT